jgi:amino-acid N-acetyltransferase
METSALRRAVTLARVGGRWDTLSGMALGERCEGEGDQEVAGGRERFHLRAGTVSDLPGIRALLAAAQLPFDDVEPGRQDFLVAVAGSVLIGCVALERFDDAALLRSLVVAGDQRGVGLGGALYERAVARARGQDLRRLFLLTTSAGPFFLRREFQAVDRSAAPVDMAASAQFVGLCPSTAACLSLPL